METAPMGKVIVTAKVENVVDIAAVQQGTIAPEQVRFVEVNDALVDTGAFTLAMPRRLIQQLGLARGTTRQVLTAAGGRTTVQQFLGAQLTIQGRDCECQVVELPDDLPVLIGQVPLELLDFVVDPKSQRLIGNPAHGGEQILDLLGFTLLPSPLHPR